MDFDTPTASGARQVVEEFVQKVKGNQTGLVPGQRDPRLAAVGVNDVRSVVGTLLPPTKQLQKAMQSTRTLDDIRQVVLKHGTTDRKANVLQFIEAVQAEQGKQSIGRSLLSLIDESRQPQTLVQAITNANAVIDRLQDASTQEAARKSIASANSMEDLRKVILLLPDAELRARLFQAVQTQEANLETLRSKIETWYDQTMDRVRGIYKRRTQWWLLVISTVMVALIGADSLQMYNSLAGNPALRAAVVAEAGKSGSASTRSLPQLINQLSGTTLPVGYGGGPNPTQGVTWWKWLAEKLLGLLITIFAVSLGAPFWFDVLQKVSDIRAAGPPTDRQTASKPPASAQ